MSLSNALTGFMNRFVKKFSDKYSDVSEITMQNFV